MNAYGEKEWAEEMVIAARPQPEIRDDQFVYNWGSFYLECPDCRTFGFYSPRREPITGEPKRKYRACKFCGFAQEFTGYVYDNDFDKHQGKPYRWVMVQCEACAPKFLAASYTWKVPWNTGGQPCEVCKLPCSREVPWPRDDESHPFNQGKKQIAECLSRNKD